MTEPRPTVPPGPTVDPAVERLETLDSAPLEAHAEVYDHVHCLLQQALATLDEA